MEKIKIFYGYWGDGDDDTKDTQKEVNKWLEKNPAFSIKNLSTSYDDEEYVLTIHYTTTNTDLLP